MVKTVAKRGWSVEKFGESVKAACERKDVAFAKSKLQKAYDDGLSVAAAVNYMAGTKTTATRVAVKEKTAAAPKKKAA